MATAVLIAVWAAATFGARPLTPLVRAAAEHVEVALGFDVARGGAE